MMKLKIKQWVWIAAVIIFGMMIPAVRVLADNELLITFQVDTGEASFPMEISMEFKNMDTGKTAVIECNYDNSYRWVAALEEGKYTLSSYKVMSYGSEGGVPQELDYVVAFDDFGVFLYEGDKTVTGTVMDRATYEAIYGRQDQEDPEEEPADLSWIHDGTTDHNVANPQEATNQVDIAYYTIPQDNKYFPGWTVMEIQDWYKQQVREYLATDYAQDYMQRWNYFDEEWIYEAVAEFAAEEITYYPTEEYGPNEENVGQELRGLNGFTLHNGTFWRDLVYYCPNKEEYPAFYEANKKLLTFILEYYWETGVQLNFNIWDYNDLPAVIAFPAASSPEDPEEKDAAQGIDAPEADDGGTAQASGTRGEAASTPEEESGKAGYILIGILGAVLVCGAGAGVYFYRRKDR